MAIIPFKVQCKLHILLIVIKNPGFSVAQWLGLCASTAGGRGSTLGWRTKMPHSMAKKRTKK